MRRKRRKKNRSRLSLLFVVAIGLLAFFLLENRIQKAPQSQGVKSSSSFSSSVSSSSERGTFESSSVASVIDDLRSDARPEYSLKTENGKRYLLSGLSDELEITGPIDDCLKSAHLYAREEDLESECTLNYVHFFPSKIKEYAETPPEKFMVGSFNIFHLGDNQTPLKNLGLVAEIMNQWDIVAAQELMPLPSDPAKDNQRIYTLVAGESDSLVSFPHDDWRVTEPGYLSLLKALRQLDPSWALIMQSLPEGEGNSGEMSGYYYRSRYVQLKELKYCPRERAFNIKAKTPIRNFACLTSIPESQRKLMSRVGFSAFFQVGNFDFIGVTTHVRFRADPDEEDRLLQQEEICSSHHSPKKCKLTKDTVGRFYEVKAVADQFPVIQELSSDQDIIYMGDFNLEMTGKMSPLWDAALKSAPGYKVLQDQPTTLTIKNEGLASNYDHFILNDRATKECDVESARPYDFTKARSPGNDPLLKKIAQYLTPESRKALLDERHREIQKLVFPEKSKGQESVRAINEKEIARMMERYESSLKRMNENEIGALLELLSDHLPIEIACRSSGPDDD